MKHTENQPDTKCIWLCAGEQPCRRSVVFKGITQQNVSDIISDSWL